MTHRALNNDQFPQFAEFRGDPYVVYHGTTPESAEGIHKRGFDDSMIGSRHGAETDGHYFADTPQRASEYGPKVVAARLKPFVDVHPQWWSDADMQEDVYVQGKPLRESLVSNGYHGFTDEDGATVMAHGGYVRPLRTDRSPSVPNVPHVVDPWFLEHQ